MSRDEVLKALTLMPPARFEELLFQLGIPKQRLSDAGSPQAIRALEAIGYLESAARFDALRERLTAPGDKGAPSQAAAPGAALASSSQPAARQGGTSAAKIRCFIDFASGDQQHAECLLLHLKVLQRSRHFEVHTRMSIAAGASDLAEEIHRRLDEADIVVLLVSAEFLADDELIARARRAIRQRRARVVPVIVSPCRWEVEYGKYLVLPRNNRPVSAWRDAHEAMQSVASEIDVLIKRSAGPQGGGATSGGGAAGHAAATALSGSSPPLTPASGRIKILFLAAAPIDAARLRLGEEVREIERRLRMGEHRDRFVLDQAWAVTPGELSHTLLRHKPTVVHFSGHGNADQGLLLQDDAGRAVSVPGNALAALFELFASEGLRGVVLNSCYSALQAPAIVQHVDFVVSISDAIGDADARAFSAGFYMGLVDGRSLQKSFKFGRLEVSLLNLPDSGVLQLHTRPGIDPDAMKLV